MSVQLRQHFHLNRPVIADVGPVNITDADMMCQSLEVLAVWHNEADSEHLAAVGVQTQVVDERTQLQ